MKIAVIGKSEKDVNSLKRQIKIQGYKVVNKNPDVVISFGGDGSFLISERMFPSVPKLLIRNKGFCKKCNENDLKKLLTKIKTKKYRVKQYYKIEAKIKRHNEVIRKIAANDIVIRNREPYHALRFNISVNNKKIKDEIIGDGIVVATPFGSTGYFESITRKNFKRGIGIAFNNPTEKLNPLILKEGVIKLKVIRNSAVVSSDNDPLIISIDKDDFVEIKKSKEKFSIISIK